MNFNWPTAVVRLSLAVRWKHSVATYHCGVYWVIKLWIKIVYCIIYVPLRKYFNISVVVNRLKNKQLPICSSVWWKLFINFFKQTTRELAWLVEMTQLHEPMKIPERKLYTHKTADHRALCFGNILRGDHTSPSVVKIKAHVMQKYLDCYHALPRKSPESSVPQIYP